MEHFHLWDVATAAEEAEEPWSPSGMGDAIERAAEMIMAARSVVAFTGAGISVESGIPDFRSPDGLWSNFDPDTYCSYEIFLERPELFWQMARSMEMVMAGAQPNAAHLALAELETMGRMSCVITQNVDNLHQAAGSSRVLELHGSAQTMSCHACRHVALALEAIPALAQGVTVPRCPLCEGVMKMDVILFGEPLPQAVMQAALSAAVAADVLLVVGTSLTVSPANSLTDLCRGKGGKLIVCNKSSDSLRTADVALQGPAAKVLPQLVAACRKLRGRRL